MARRIKNVTGTSGRRNCGCRTWIEHYYLHGGTGEACVACRRRPVVGGHVFVEETYVFGLVQTRKLGEHIVPLCAACNMREGWMEAVVDDFKLISANTQKMRCAVR